MLGCIECDGGDPIADQGTARRHLWSSRSHTSQTFVILSKHFHFTPCAQGVLEYQIRFGEGVRMGGLVV